MLQIVAHIFRYPITREQFRLLEDTDLSNKLELTMQGMGVSYEDWNWSDGYIEFRATNNAVFIDNSITQMFAPLTSIVAFNTGRSYSKHGQRIACKMVDDVIYFVDIDRGIDGKAHVGPVEDLRQVVMRHYDDSAYDHFSDCDLKKELLSAAALVDPK